MTTALVNPRDVGPRGTMNPERAAKVAAKRLGLTADEYNAHRAASEKWCYGCRDWHRFGLFNVDRSRHDGLSNLCRNAIRARYRPTAIAKETSTMKPTVRRYPKLRDAREPVSFTVGREHVKGSVVGDPEQCAGSCALRAIPDVKNAWVFRTRTILEYEDGTVLRWRNPNGLQRGVENFDTTAGLFPPGEYTLRPLCKSQRAPANKGRKHTDDGTRPGSSRSRPLHALR